ncbi:MAG: flavin reductase [Erysipelotrichaceae bacterium]|nr:flavin reductase [Erysipelotrichaceae bacterium]MBR0342884.1 flavin reductase [Oscillospiraceae bacterium]
MKEKINVFDYSELITKALRPGILLNSNGEKFNAMVIGWGHLGVIWGLDTFTVYVRQSRYTKAQLDKAGEFTLSIPLDGVDKEINRVCGTLSGRDINKADYVTLVEPETNNTPGIKEYPLTIECKIIYKQDQDLEKIPDNVIDRYYGKGSDVGDFHTAYIGQIVDAYIIKD